jgi:urease accessory protein
VIARALLAAEADGRGATRLSRVRSEAPLVLRATSDDTVYVVGGAAGPLGGDDLGIEVHVGAGATLTVRSAAASVALPGPAPSRLAVRATVAAGGALRWLPEPTVAARGCRHHVDTSVEVDAGGRLLWREELVLGRHRERSGSMRTRLSVDVDGQSLLRSELAVGPDFPAWATPAVVGGHRAVGSVLVVDPAWRLRPPPAVVLGPTAASMPLAGPGVQVVAVADDMVALRRLLDAQAARALWSAGR